MVADFICFSLFTSELKFVFVACVWHMLTGPDLTFCDGPVEKHIQFPERTLHSSFETVYILWSFLFIYFSLLILRLVGIYTLSVWITHIG